MNVTAEKLVAEVLEMPAHVRAFVVEKLIESLDLDPGEGLSPAWREEIARRCREIDEGTVVLRDAEQVFAEAFARLG